LFASTASKHSALAARSLWPQALTTPSVKRLLCAPTDTPNKAVTSFAKSGRYVKEWQSRDSTKKAATGESAGPSPPVESASEASGRAANSGSIKSCEGEQ
jgi:hypothetical protein